MLLAYSANVSYFCAGRLFDEKSVKLAFILECAKLMILEKAST